MAKKDQDRAAISLAELAAQIRASKKPLTKSTLSEDADRWTLIEKFMAVAPVEAVVEMVKAGSIPKRGGFESTPLYIAVMNDLVHMVKPLVDAGCNVNQQCVYEMSPLSHALAQGEKQKDGSMVRALLELGAHGSDHGDVMIWAARCGHVHNIIELLDHGHDINKRCRTSGQTPLVTAIWQLVMPGKEKNAEATIKALLERGADPNKPSRSQSNPETFETPYGVLTSLRSTDKPPKQHDKTHEPAEESPDADAQFAKLLGEHGITLRPERNRRTPSRAHQHVDFEGIIDLLRKNGLDPNAKASAPTARYTPAM